MKQVAVQPKRAGEKILVGLEQALSVEKARTGADEEISERAALLAVRAVLKAALNQAANQRYMRQRIETLVDAASISVGLINCGLSSNPSVGTGTRRD